MNDILDENSLALHDRKPFSHLQLDTILTSAPSLSSLSKMVAYVDSAKPEVFRPSSSSS